MVHGGVSVTATLGYALADSPAGQLAWMVDIYQRFCDVPEGATVDEVIGLDRLLTAASLYWFTSSGASSAQVYYEDMSASSWDDGGAWADDGGDEEASAEQWGDADDWGGGESGVPTAVLVATRRDTPVRAFAERDHSIVRWTEVDDGGHFFATERPDAFADDVRDFFAGLS